MVVEVPFTFIYEKILISSIIFYVLVYKRQRNAWLHTDQLYAKFIKLRQRINPTTDNNLQLIIYLYFFAWIAVLPIISFLINEFVRLLNHLQITRLKLRYVLILFYKKHEIIMG